MKRSILAFGLFFATALPASAATVVVTPAPYAAPSYSGTPTIFTFDSGGADYTTRFSGGGVVSGSTGGQYSAPTGDATNYYSVGPSTSTPATVNLAGLGSIQQISLYWGSVDKYNTLELLAGSTVLATITGSDVVGSPDGTTSYNVVINLTPSETGSITGLQFSSSENAFEFDNLAVGSVPEPASWALMIGGLGLVGMAMRRRSRVSVAVA